MPTSRSSEPKCAFDTTPFVTWNEGIIPTPGNPAATTTSCSRGGSERNTRPGNAEPASAPSPSMRRTAMSSVSSAATRRAERVAPLSRLSCASTSVERRDRSLDGALHHVTVRHDERLRASVASRPPDHEAAAEPALARTERLERAGPGRPHHDGGAAGIEGAADCRASSHRLGEAAAKRSLDLLADVPPRGEQLLLRCADVTGSAEGLQLGEALRVDAERRGEAIATEPVLLVQTELAELDGDAGRRHLGAELRALGRGPQPERAITCLRARDRDVLGLLLMLRELAQIDPAAGRGASKRALRRRVRVASVLGRATELARP